MDEKPRSEIVIKQTEPTLRNLESKVSNFSFRITLIAPFTVYPQADKHIVEEAFVSDVLDGYALLSLSHNNIYAKI